MKKGQNTQGLVDFFFLTNEVAKMIASFEW